MAKKKFADLANACWKGYKAVGLKDKNGRKVPNCVPEERQITADEIETADYKISPSGRKVRAHHIKVGEKEKIEEATVKTQKYSWGTMKTVHHGSDISYPLHPEHQKIIKNLRPSGEHSKAMYKDETGNQVHVTREDDKVHFVSHRTSGSKKTTVDYKHFDESIKGLREEEEHLVHVSDGSKYGDKPSKKDTEHVMTGAKMHGGEYDGSSDKGAYFKFKTRDSARNFKRHVDSCPDKTCHADLHEQAPVAPAPHIHRVAVTVSEPDHPMVTKRKEQKQKFIRVTDHRADKDVAVERAKKHYAKKGYKVHGAEHVGMMHEEVEQIDELSDTTLASYKEKAKKSADELTAQGKHKQATDRWGNVMKATGKQIEKTTANIRKALNKEGYVVRYNNPKSEKHGSEKHFDDQAAAQKHADNGNSVDKIGGKYTVHKTNEKGHDMNEALTGNQQKLDKNKNGKLDKQDFKLLRKEDAEQVEEGIVKGTVEVVKQAVRLPYRAVKRAASAVLDTAKDVGDAAANVKKKFKEDFEDGEMETKVKSYKEFLQSLDEIKMADLPSRKVTGRGYGTEYYKKEAEADKKGYDDDNNKPVKPAGEKRGRGRPVGSTSGARQKGSIAKRKGSGVEMTGYPLHLPNNK